MSGGTDSMVLNLQSGFRDQVKRIDFRESKLEKVRALCLSFGCVFVFVESNCRSSNAHSDWYCLAKPANGSVDRASPPPSALPLLA
jgi:hypothetical protein